MFNSLKDFALMICLLTNVTRLPKGEETLILRVPEITLWAVLKDRDLLCMFKENS